MADTLLEIKLDKLRRLRELQQQQRELDNGDATRKAWHETARPDQREPEGDWFVWLILAGRGWGKGSDIRTLVPVYTNHVLPSNLLVPGPGWKKLGDIEVGDTIFDESGRHCRVLATFDYTPKIAYRFHFSDGTHIDVCDEHQWVTWTHAERKAYLRSQHEVDTSRFPEEWPTWRVSRLATRSLPRDMVEKALAMHAEGLSVRSIATELECARQALTPHVKAGAYIERQPTVRNGAVGPQIRTTQDIINTLTYGKRNDTNHCVPTCGPLQLPEKDLFIDPWVLGFWLGDGFSRGGYVCCGREDIEILLERIVECGHVVSWKKKESAAWILAIEDLGKSLRFLGLLNNKHVPDDYLWGSIDQREALLRGLMDSDGHCNPEGSKVEFCNTNKDLVDAVVHLARSLGQKPVCTEGRATLDGRDCGPKWRVTWRPTRNPFSFPRKAERVRELGTQGLRNHHRMIVKAERIDPVPMRCLTVDSPHSMFLIGEGMIPTHNTRTAAELVAEKARRFPGARVALVGRTFSDVRDTMVEGDSGLLSCFKQGELRGGKIDGAWNRSLGELYLDNGSKFSAYSSEKPWQLRGPQFHFAWGDESCFWADAHKGTTADTTWSNLTIATRLPRRGNWSLDYKTCIVVATTPRPVALLKVSDPQQVSPGLMQRDNVIITRGRTVDNLENLSDSYKTNVVAPLLGTQLGLQELDAEILENRDNALWRREWIEADRYNAERRDELDLVRIVVGVDPSVTSSEAADLTGIVVCAADRAGNGYVLADYTMRGTPKQCMQRAVDAYHEFNADRIVAEVNNGGDYIGTVVRAVDTNVAFKAVRASRGKNTRAEPISALYEQHRVHHVGMFPQLEDEMCTWAPGDPESPDRMDALVWAMYDLKDLIGGSWLDAYGVLKCHKCERGFTKTLNGTPREKCPYCNTPVEEVA